MSKNEKKKKEKIVTLRVDQGLFDKIDQTAKEEGRSLTDQYRWMFNNYLKKGEKDGN